MAGIGFELKKLFKKKGLIANVEAYLYSTIVTIGPTLICIILITSLNFLLKANGTAVVKIELLQATIMYSFIFSLVLVSGYCMVLSRYLADKLYFKQYEDIVPSLIGSLALMITIGGVIGIIFYFKSPLDFAYKFFAYGLFMELIIETIVSTYVSALKNYKKISISFIVSVFIGVIAGVLIYKYTELELILAILIAFNIGFLILILLLINEVQKYFNLRSNNYFEVLQYFKKFILIFFTNTFWMSGLYVHNFVLWVVPEINYFVGKTYVYSPAYDIPAFYSFLTIMPTLVIFVVKFETAFFVKYSNYFYFINNGASYEDIKAAKEEMKGVLFKELSYVMEIQLFFTLGFIIIGMKLLPLIGFTTKMIDLFNILSLAYYCAISMFVIMTILLYFEDREGAAISTGILLVGNFIFTGITVFLGATYYGIGMLIAAILALIFSINRLEYFIENIEYYVFCKHTSWR